MLNLADKDTHGLLNIRVYIEDTDAGGIVYYVNYLKYLERARTEYIRSIGHEKAAIFDDKILFVVHSLKINYRSPGFLDDLITVYTKTEKISKVAILFKQKIFRDRELLIDADVKIVSVGVDNKKITLMPKSLIDKLKNF